MHSLVRFCVVTMGVLVCVGCGTTPTPTLVMSANYSEIKSTDAPKDGHQIVHICRPSGFIGSPTLYVNEDAIGTIPRGTYYRVEYPDIKAGLKFSAKVDSTDRFSAELVSESDFKQKCGELKQTAVRAIKRSGVGTAAAPLPSSSKRVEHSGASEEKSSVLVPTTAETANQIGIPQKLRELKALLDERVISEEEYKIKKAKLLDSY